MPLEFAAFCSEQAKLRRVIIYAAHRLCDVLSVHYRCSISICCATCLFCLSRCIRLRWRELVRNLKRPIILLLICHPGSDCKDFILTLGRSLYVLSFKCLHHLTVMIIIIISYIYAYVSFNKLDRMARINFDLYAVQTHGCVYTGSIPNFLLRFFFLHF